MNLNKISFNKKLIIGVLIFAPIFIISLVILFRNFISPSNESIINELRNTKLYSSKVNYVFKNSKSQFEENTIQYYSFDKGARIEFKDGYERVKVYKGGEIKVKENSDGEYILNKDIDTIYPLAFIENILSSLENAEIKEVKTEWSDSIYLQVDITYNSNNKHLNKAEFFVDKDKGVPVLLKILDDDNKERIIITYKDFKKEKSLSDNLF
nr:germination lipoprotein GerS-related protein [Clostridium puniceum]